MPEEGRHQPKIIDEDGLPVLDVTGVRERTSPSQGDRPSAAPTFTVFTSDTRFLTADGSRPSLRKLLGWRGIAFLVVVLAIVIALAIVSIVAFAIVVPVLLLVGLIGAGLRRAQGLAR